MYTVYTTEELTGANIDLNKIKNEKKRAREEKAIAKKMEKLQGYKDEEALFTAKLQERFPDSQVAFLSSYEPTPAPIWLVTLLLMGAGFFIYGPQALIGIVAANQATKEAAAMANGFTGIMGYASTIVSGIGIAFIQVHYGWALRWARLPFLLLSAWFSLLWRGTPGRPVTKPILQKKTKY